MTVLGLEDFDGPALIDSVSGLRLSRSELVDEALSFVSPIGVARSLVLLLCDMSPFTPVFYAGALLADHPVALVDARAPAVATASTLAAYGPEWVAGPVGTANTLAEAGIEGAVARTSLGGELVRLAVERRAPLHPELALLLATSGTTGSTKFVRLTRANVESNARAIAEYLSLTPDERPIGSLPLHYSFGLSVLNSHWSAGAPLVLTPASVLQRAFWGVMETHECTSLAGVPFTYEMLERVGFREMELPALHTLQQAGGALDIGLAKAFGEHMAARGGRFFVMYGQTEATARIAYVPPDRLADKPGSAGIAVPGGRLGVDPGRTTSDDGRSVGEVIYSGPNVMMGYASTAADLALGDKLGGVLRTGDIGYLDDESFLFLVGRSKRIAKVFGLRVNLDEVERRLRADGPVAVVGAGESIWAFIGFGDVEKAKQIRQVLAQEYRVHKSALHVEVVDQIPTTSSGKTDYEQVQTWIPS